MTHAETATDQTVASPWGGHPNLLVAYAANGTPWPQVPVSITRWEKSYQRNSEGFRVEFFSRRTAYLFHTIEAGREVVTIQLPGRDAEDSYPADRFPSQLER